MCASGMAEAIAPSLAVAAIQAKDVGNLVYNRGHQNANPRKRGFGSLLPIVCLFFTCHTISQLFQKTHLHKPIYSCSQMGMCAWHFTRYGGIETKKSQSLSYENSHSNAGTYRPAGDSSLTSAAIEAHVKLTTCMKKGMVCLQEIILYIVCVISVSTTYLVQGCVHWKLFINGNPRIT